MLGDGRTWGQDLRTATRSIMPNVSRNHLPVKPQWNPLSLTEESIR